MSLLLYGSSRRSDPTHQTTITLAIWVARDHGLRGSVLPCYRGTLEELPISAEHCSGNWCFQWCSGISSHRIVSNLGTLDCDMVSSKNHPDCWIDCKQYVPPECVTTRE